MKVEHLLDAQCSNVTRHGEQVKKNRLILHRFIDTVCYLANPELLFWGHGELSTSVNKGNLMEFRNVLKNYDPLLENYLNSATVFQGTSASGPGERSRYSDLLWAGRSREQIQVGARFSATILTGPGTHPASCIMSTGSFPEVKRPGYGASHPTPF
jgi:hypothetical protein